MKQVIFVTYEDMHPYECNGPGNCIHCEQGKNDKHDPDYCWLCHDGEPPKVEERRLQEESNLKFDL